MNILRDIYYKSLAENEKNIRFWEDYRNSLKALDFSVFSDKLKVPALVPIGSRIFFRGELKHTNEVTVALGADYFAKCSLKQAEVLRQHRIKDAQTKLNTFKQEREYLENQLSFGNRNIYEDQGQEIIEVYSEEEDKEWRKTHRENIRKYKQKNASTKETNEDNDITEVTDEELWNRLEELELQEELDNELLKSKQGEEQCTEDYSEPLDSSADSFIIKEEDECVTKKDNESKGISSIEENTKILDPDIDGSSKQSSKFDILQKVLHKQHELEEKLVELRNKDRKDSKSERDLISRLDDMEQLDDLEDEMDRLDDIIQSEDIESEADNTSPHVKVKRSVSFADEDESETLELTFTHSDVEPCGDPYNPDKGILKPTDIYEAYSNLFSAETASILKKTKYDTGTVSNDDPKVEKKSVAFQEDDEHVVNETIVVKDVVESKRNDKKLETSARPTSLFKKKRLQMKS